MSYYPHHPPYDDGSLRRINIPPQVSLREELYGRPTVPSHGPSNTVNSVPMYPQAPNSQYNNVNYNTPTSPQGYRQAPPPPTAPRAFTNQYNYSQNYMPGQSIPPRTPMPSGPVYSQPQPVPLYPITTSMPSSSTHPFGADSGLPSPTLPPLCMSDELAPLSPLDSPLSPTARRSQSHPEGMPQPKGRGARKSTKPDDMTKTLSCDGCDAMFARKHDLDRHRRIHTLEAPYMCRGCRRSYRRSDARKRHWDQEPSCNILHVRNSDGGTASSP